MPDEEGMTEDERRKYLKRMRGRYELATRVEQGRLLDEMEAVTGLHRKSLIRLLKLGGLERKDRQKQRGREYGWEVEKVVRVVAETLDYICAERMQPALVWVAEELAAHGEIELSVEVKTQLAVMSVSTLRRMLGRIRQDVPRLPRKPASPTTGLAGSVPIRRIAWDEGSPGHLEMDLVHHCGLETAGTYVHSLQGIDVATGWSERAAVWGRGQLAMEAALRRIEGRVPFPIVEIHTDNGSEFLNHHLLRYFQNREPAIQVSRSRPYCKNDNRFVEQKNDTLVRAYFGQARFDTQAHQRLLDRLYDEMWWYYNFFQPVLHLVNKERCEDEVGQGRIRRRWDTAQTPWQRLCTATTLAPATREQLLTRREQTNPRQLRKQIYLLRDQLFALPLVSALDEAALLADSRLGARKYYTGRRRLVR